jgi:hypothetical protein
MYVLYILFSLCCSVYCLCVNVYCTTATGQLTQYISYHIVSYITSYHISHHIINKKTVNISIHVTFWRVGVTIVSLENQWELHILTVRLWAYLSNMQNECAVLYCHLWRCQDLPYFSTLSDTRHEFRENLIEYKMCFFDLPQKPLSKIFLIPRKIKRDVIINVHRSACKVPVIFLHNFLDRFSKNTQIYNA